MSGINLGVNEQSVAKIFRALVEALPCDPIVLQPLMDKVSKEVHISGLGYIGADALQEIQANLRAGLFLQEGAHGLL